MSKKVDVLPTTTDTLDLPKYTDEIYATDNGTIYFHDNGGSTCVNWRIYTIWQGKEIYVPFSLLLGETHIARNFYGYGNALYVVMRSGVFEIPSKIYKIVFTPPDQIDVIHVRDLEKFEQTIGFYNGYGAIQRTEECGRKFIKRIYRFWESPEDAIIDDSYESDYQEMNFEGIYRGQFIYISEIEDDSRPPSVRKLKTDEQRAKKEIVVDLPYRCRLGSTTMRDKDPFIYFPCESNSFHGAIIYTLNLEEMEFLPMVQIKAIPNITEIIGVFNGIIHVTYSKSKATCILTAVLPSRYYDQSSIIESLEISPMAIAEISKQESISATNVEIQGPYSSDEEFSVEELAAFESEFLKKFKSHRILGQGGFGCVFEARNLMDDWNYAVKRIPLKGTDEAVTAALNEVRTLASIKNDGIVGYNSSWMEKPPYGWQKKADTELLERLDVDAILNYKDDCVFIYIQMELCNQTLVDWLNTNKTRDQTHTKFLFKQLVSAVAYLHGRNKIHRDLKPSNILFGLDGKLKICDLGIAADRAIINGQEVDKTRTATGTFMYMAPEQRGFFYTSKVDIFSLGLIFIEISVCMTNDVACEVFMDCRRGVSNSILDTLPNAAVFASWLTNVDPNKRPDCETILSSEFLA